MLMPDNKPIEQGELAESPNSHFDHRSRNLTDAAIHSRAFLIYDIRLGNSRPVCVRALQIHLKNLTMIDRRHETSSTLRFPTKDIIKSAPTLSDISIPTLSNIQLNLTPPSKGLSGAQGVYSTGCLKILAVIH